MNEIEVKYGDVSRLAKICGCSIQSVRFSLRGAVKSDLSDRIRKEAIAMGGREIKKMRVQPSR